MFTTLFSSDVLMGVLVGSIFSLSGVLINAFVEARKEARREKSSRLAEVRRELGIDKGVQGSGVILYINSVRPWWSRILMLFGVILHYPDLSNSNLRRVNLARKDLRGTNFSYANLSEADLSGANLKHANFQGAILIKTNFYGAKFDDDTKFWEAIVFDTPGIHDSAYVVGIKDMTGLEKRFGKAPSSPDDLEKLFNSNGVDTISLPIKDIYWNFFNADQRPV